MSYYKSGIPVFEGFVKYFLQSLHKPTMKNISPSKFLTFEHFLPLRRNLSKGYEIPLQLAIFFFLREKICRLYQKGSIFFLTGMIYYKILELANQYFNCTALRKLKYFEPLGVHGIYINFSTFFSYILYLMF